MRMLLVGAGGVGAAFARIEARRRFAELVIADYDLDRAQRAAAAGRPAGRPGRTGDRGAVTFSSASG